MNERIDELLEQVGGHGTKALMHPDDVMKFAELIVRKCADAADMAYDARCNYPGDYVAEWMGFGEKEGVVTWRANEQSN